MISFRLMNAQGNLRFTTSSARDEFTRMVLHAFRAPPLILNLANICDARMRERVGGRLWMGAHMRRTDCESLNPSYYQCQTN